MQLYTKSTEASGNNRARLNRARSSHMIFETLKSCRVLLYEKHNRRPCRAQLNSLAPPSGPHTLYGQPMPEDQSAHIKPPLGRPLSQNVVYSVNHFPVVVTSKEHDYMWPMQISSCRSRPPQVCKCKQANAHMHLHRCPCATHMSACVCCSLPLQACRPTRRVVDRANDARQVGPETHTTRARELEINSAHLNPKTPSVPRTSGRRWRGLLSARRGRPCRRPLPIPETHAMTPALSVDKHPGQSPRQANSLHRRPRTEPWINIQGSDA